MDGLKRKANANVKKSLLSYQCGCRQQCQRKCQVDCRPIWHGLLLHTQCVAPTVQSSPTSLVRCWRSTICQSHPASSRAPCSAPRILWSAPCRRPTEHPMISSSRSETDVLCARCLAAESHLQWTQNQAPSYQLIPDSPPTHFYHSNYYVQEQNNERQTNRHLSDGLFSRTTRVSRHQKG